jgi:hypothetical protein
MKSKQFVICYVRYKMTPQHHAFCGKLTVIWLNGPALAHIGCDGFLTMFIKIYH